MTTAATASKPAAPDRTPNDAPKAAAATAMGAMRRAPSLCPALLVDPVTREIEPEGEPSVATVRTEAALDARVLHRLAPVQPRELWPCPGVEDEPRIATEQHHHVRRGVGADSGKLQQPRLDLLVGQVGLSGELLEV